MKKIVKKEGFYIMKKLFSLLLVAVMCFSLAACGGDEPQTDNNGSQQKTQNNKKTEITVENWQDYLEFVVEYEKLEGKNGGIWYYPLLFIQTKEGVTISNETNTRIHFTYKLDKQQYTTSVEDNELILGDIEPYSEDIYPGSYPMYKNSNSDWCEELNFNGESYFAPLDDESEGQSWNAIPTELTITKIEGTIIAE